MSCYCHTLQAATIVQIVSIARVFLAGVVVLGVGCWRSDVEEEKRFVAGRKMAESPAGRDGRNLEGRAEAEDEEATGDEQQRCCYQPRVT